MSMTMHLVITVITGMSKLDMATGQISILLPNLSLIGCEKNILSLQAVDSLIFPTIVHLLTFCVLHS